MMTKKKKKRNIKSHNYFCRYGKLHQSQDIIIQKYYGKNNNFCVGNTKKWNNNSIRELFYITIIFDNVFSKYNYKMCYYFQKLNDNESVLK